MRSTLVLCAALVVGPAVAQEQPATPDPCLGLMDSPYRDAMDAVPQLPCPLPVDYAAGMAAMIDESLSSIGEEDQDQLKQNVAALLQQAVELRDAFSGNPNVEVTGFTVNVGLAPSIAVEFRFK